MGKLLEEARKLNTERIIRRNFILLKQCYGVNNTDISQDTGVSVEQLNNIDNSISVSFNVYDKLAEYFGVYVSDLFSEVSLKEKLSLFPDYDLSK